MEGAAEDVHQKGAYIEREVGMTKSLAPLEACDRAAEHLRVAGFVFAVASMKSTSCYYSRPGYFGTIRVSVHSKKKDRHRFHQSGPVVSRATFPACGGPVTELRVQNAVANAIGMFMLKARAA